MTSEMAASDADIMIVPSNDLDRDIERLAESGFRLDMITPADSPRVAELSGHGLRLRLDTTQTVTTHAVAEAVFADDFVLIRSQQTEGDEGRAGMHYRDLLPKRHGGHVIASHITIPGAGPVPDYVHHHDIGFQLIFVRRGRVRVVYEDQGEPFWMEPGDCVLQPPHIRHRVLESEGDCEVIEVASPAEHPTFVEHVLALPNGRGDVGRLFGGQRFHFQRGVDALWESVDGWSISTTGIDEASRGAGSVRVLRSNGGGTLRGQHDGSLFLFVVLDGECVLDSGELGVHKLHAGDSAAVPEGTPWSLTDGSADCAVLHVTMP